MTGTCLYTRAPEEESVSGAIFVMIEPALGRGSNGRILMKHAVKIAALMAAGLMLGSAATAPAYADGKPQLAFVVNIAADFWKAAEAGMAKAQAELPDYQLVFKYPD